MKMKSYKLNSDYEAYISKFGCKSMNELVGKLIENQQTTQALYFSEKSKNIEGLQKAVVDLSLKFEDVLKDVQSNSLENKRLSDSIINLTNALNDNN